MTLAPSLDAVIAASLFTVVSYITPGPNNTMILASGVNFGLRRSMPHLLGICLGFGFMLVVVGLGLQSVFARYPVVLEVLRYAGAAYLLWLAFQLATTRHSSTESRSAARPLSFIGAAAFQWVNPKAWVMAVTAMSTYLPAEASLVQVLLLSALMTVVGSPCVLCWAAFGNAMRSFLQDPLRLRIFNIAMALGLVASLYPLVQG
jgi:threonine/homoserine/homoserine lactone efflux protein